MPAAAIHPTLVHHKDLSIAGIIIELEAILSKKLSPDRFAHVRRVKHTAIALSRRFSVPVEWASLAALAHDWAREWSGKEIQGFLKGHGISLSRDEKLRPVLAHGKVAVFLLESHFGLKNEAINEAVAHHTLGQPGMGQLARILFVADYLEPGRSFTTLAFRRSTRRLCLACQVKSVIDHCLKRHGDLHPMTKGLYDQVIAECQCREVKAMRGERHE